MKKRIVSILLASAMALNLTAVPTLAAEPVIEVINNISEEEISLETSAEEIIADEIVEADQQTAPQEEQPSDESLPIIIEETPSADAPTSPSEVAPDTTPSGNISQNALDSAKTPEILETIPDETLEKLESLFPGLPED